jgi:hypothetical protein
VIYRTIGLQYLAILLGISWGWSARTYPWQVPTLWAAPAALALIMLSIGLLKPKRTPGKHTNAKVSKLLAALVPCSVLVMVFDPFINADDESSCFLGIALIVLPLLCLKALVRRRAWLAIGGVVVFQLTEVASLVYNFPALRGGVGYFGIWIV